MFQQIYPENHSHSQVGDSQFVVEHLRNRVSAFEKQLIEKNAIVDFFLKKNNFDTSDLTRRKDQLEPNNTNSKNEIQKVRNTCIGNGDSNKPSK